jgi:hypothetical protein
MEVMLKQVFRALGISGDSVMGAVNGVVATVNSAKAQLDRIEAQQNRIEHKLDYLCARAATADAASVEDGAQQRLALTNGG